MKDIFDFFEVTTKIHDRRAKRLLVLFRSVRKKLHLDRFVPPLQRDRKMLRWQQIRKEYRGWVRFGPRYHNPAALCSRGSDCRTIRSSKLGRTDILWCTFCEKPRIDH